MIVGVLEGLCVGKTQPASEGSSWSSYPVVLEHISLGGGKSPVGEDHPGQHLPAQPE